MRYENEVVFTYGFTINPEEMVDDTIYLDGACRGPAIDVGRRAYSFDHHAGCSRFATMSTCEQVLLALDMGLNPKGFRVVVNDLDADTSLALWLLFNPHKVDDRVRQEVHKIGRVDSHGPLWSPTKLHKALTRRPGVAQTFQDLIADQEKIDAWVEGGDRALPEPFAMPPCAVHGLDRDGHALHGHVAFDRPRQRDGGRNIGRDRERDRREVARAVVVGDDELDFTVARGGDVAARRLA